MDLAGLEAQAAERLGPGAYGYYVGGADEEVTLRDNVAAWQRFALHPRVLRDVSAVDCRTTVLGDPVAAPVLVPPMGFQRLAHPEGERAMAAAAAAVDTALLVSTMATVSLEDVAAVPGSGPRWFQLYAHRDRDLTARLVERAVTAGYRAVVLTVDVPVLGRRRRDERNRFTLPAGMENANLASVLPAGEGSGLAAYTGAQFDPGITFDAIGRLAGLSGLPVVVKGVLRGDDAAACVQAGASGVIVSNHGGRQLDTAVATADALSSVVRAVAGVSDSAEVYVDGGVRRGTDVVKALAMGARAVLVGRPLLWGLATGGSDGAAAVWTELVEELRRAMALCGAATVADIDATLLGPGQSNVSPR